MQCDIFEGMWLVMKEFIERVRIYQRNVGVKDFEVSHSGQLPMQEYFELIDTHVEVSGLDQNGIFFKGSCDQIGKNSNCSDLSVTLTLSDTMKNTHNYVKTGW